MIKIKWKANIVSVIILLVLIACSGSETPEVLPKEWQKLVKTEGQFFPIPEAWISTPEGKNAHNIQLPNSVPKPVPFDFKKAAEHHFWEKKPNVSLKYFDHLCATEAGEWVFKKIKNVEGLYFARPISQPTDKYLGDLYGPEAPWVERHFQLMGNSLARRGAQFIDPPFFSYHYFEEPRRSVEWQADILTPYVRFFGYTSEVVHNPKYQGGGAQRYLRVTEKTPMQIIGIPEVTAPYVYTWRGITRPHDRENGISGADLIIYERVTGEVVGLRRSFQLTRKNPRTSYGATWMVSPTCYQAFDEVGLGTLSEYAIRILPTIEISTTGRK